MSEKYAGSVGGSESIGFEESKNRVRICGGFEMDSLGSGESGVFGEAEGVDEVVDCSIVGRLRDLRQRREIFEANCGAVLCKFAEIGRAHV